MALPPLNLSLSAGRADPPLDIEDGVLLAPPCLRVKERVWKQVKARANVLLSGQDSESTVRWNGPSFGRNPVNRADIVAEIGIRGRAELPVQGYLLRGKPGERATGYK